MCWKMSLLMSLMMCVAVGCHGHSVTLGVVSSSQRMKTYTMDHIGRTINIDSHIVDTSEIYQIYRAVQIMNTDSSIDGIVLFDDNTLEKELSAELFIPKSKAFIRWLLKDDKKQQKRSHDSNTTPPDCLNDSDDRKNLHCRTHLSNSADYRDELLRTFVPKAVLSPVVSLSWKSVIIFYETATEYETSQLVDLLSKEGILFVMFNIEHVRDLHQLLHRIYEKRVGNQPSDIGMNIIVMCKINYTIHILKTASDFDDVNFGRKTLLKAFSRWLIAGYDHCKCVYEALQESAKQLDHVAVIAKPTEYRTIKDFHELLNETIIDVDLATKISGDVDFAEEVVKRLQEAAWSSCTSYTIDTLFWTQNGREFSSVGHVEKSGQLVLESDIYPNTKYGYNKREFLISTLPYPPFVIKNVDNGTVKYEGFCMDLLSELSHILNFTYTIFEPPDGLWGDYVSKENFTFNGLVGQLQREEVDIVAAPLSEQPERHQVIDFSHPLYYEYTTVVVRKPDPSAKKWRKLLDPLKWRVLVYIGLAFIGVTVLTFLIERWNPYYSTEKHSKVRDENGGLHTWHDAFWYMYGALLCQGGVHLPDSIAGRTLVSFWWIFCITIVGTYCGNLIAFLTVTKEVPPFNTLDEMVGMKNEYKWGTLGGSNWDMIFRTSTNPTFRAVGDSMIEFSETDPEVLNPSVGAHINKVMTENYAWIGDKTSIELAMVTECGLMTTNELFIQMSYAFGLTENSPHAPILSQHMVKMHEVGLLQIWKQKWWPKASFCSRNTVPEALPISLEDVQSAFYVCCIGIFLGLVVLLFEIILHKSRDWVRRLQTWRANIDEQQTTGL